MASYFGSYKDWVSQNGFSLRCVEQLLSGCLWLLPNRFSKSDVGAEACSSLLGLIRLWHGALLRNDGDDAVLPQSMALEAISKVEVLLEMWAEHRAKMHRSDKYTPLAALELLKLFVRLYVWMSSRKMVTTSIVGSSPGWKDPSYFFAAMKEMRHSDVPLLETELQCERENLLSACSQLTRERSSILSLAGRENSAGENPLDDDSALEFSESEEARELWFEKPEGLQELSERESEAPVHPSPNAEQCYKMGRLMLLIGETLCLLRPIISIFAIKKFGVGSWKGWGLSLALDVASQALIRGGGQLMQHAGRKRPELGCEDQLLSYFLMLRNFPWTPVDEEEMQRRKKLFFLYLLRAPAFEQLTKPGLSSAQRWMGKLPLLGKLTGKALELLYGLQQFHVYTSGAW